MKRTVPSYETHSFTLWNAPFHCLKLITPVMEWLFSLELEDIKSYLIWIQIVERDYIDGLRDSHFLTIFIQIVI